MSIENLLTLGVAVVILVAAAVLRLLVLGALHLFVALSGRSLAWMEGSAETAAAPRPRRPIARPALTGLGSLGAGLVYVLATLGTWMRSAGAAATGAAAGAYAALRPRVASGSRNGLAATGRTIRSVAILSVASAQHLGRVTSRRVRELVDERTARDAASVPVEEPSDARVIVLDREWDPLTDPLEDEPVSNVR